MTDEVPALLELAKQQQVSVTATASTPSLWSTGDYKVSAQAADHTDSGGGAWLLCDGSAIAATYAGLIGLIGGTRPDGRGRALVMKGTNAAVSSLLASDGQAVADRRPQHRTTDAKTASHNLTLPNHVHGTNMTTGVGSGDEQKFSGMDTSGATTPAATGNPSALPAIPGAVTLGGSIGTNVANDALDTPSFIVPGNLFIHT